MHKQSFYIFEELKKERMKTTYIKPNQVERKWYLVDAQGKVLGRLASRIAHILRGKHKPIYAPHMDTGDFVVVINAEKIRLTGKKWDTKEYFRHSGYMGGLKRIPIKRMLKEKPEEIIRLAVKRMIPRTPLGRRQFKKLKVYAGPDHPHKAQKVEVLEL